MAELPYSHARPSTGQRHANFQIAARVITDRGAPELFVAQVIRDTNGEKVEAAVNGVARILGELDDPKIVYARNATAPQILETALETFHHVGEFAAQHFDGNDEQNLKHSRQP